jgi:hypothetical protein
MDKSAKIILMLAAAICIVQFGDIRGKWIAFTAPRLTARDLTQSSLSLDQQRDAIIRYEHKSCEAFVPCPDATMTHDNQTIIQICRQSADQLESLSTPTGLPPAVSKNLEVYHRSLINSSRKTAEQWDTVGKRGGTFWPFVTYWEIDTCSYDSIPQQILRLYGLDKLSGKKIVRCEDTKKLYDNLQDKADY